MRIHRLERVQLVPRPVDEVFAFYADPHNLERITPPLLRFRVLTPAPIPMKRGARIDYRPRLHGLPFGWRTEIAAREPPGARPACRWARGWPAPQGNTMTNLAPSHRALPP